MPQAPRIIRGASLFWSNFHATEQEANGKTVYSEALSEAKKYLAAT